VRAPVLEKATDPLVSDRLVFRRSA